MSAVSNVEFYRKRAAEMRDKALTAPTEELRRSYRVLAEDWARLARDAGDLAPTSDSPSSPEP